MSSEHEQRWEKEGQTKIALLREGQRAAYLQCVDLERGGSSLRDEVFARLTPEADAAQESRSVQRRKALQRGKTPPEFPADAAPRGIPMQVAPYDAAVADAAQGGEQALRESLEYIVKWGNSGMKHVAQEALAQFEVVAAALREAQEENAELERERVRLRDAWAEAQEQLRQAEARNPEIGYGYYHHDGCSLTQGDGESTVMLYRTDELQVEVNRERRRAEAAEARVERLTAALREIEVADVLGDRLAAIARAALTEQPAGEGE